MSKYVQIVECESAGVNCTTIEYVPIDVLASPLNAIDIGSSDFWALVTATYAFLALCWGTRRLIKFIAK